MTEGHPAGHDACVESNSGLEGPYPVIAESAKGPKVSYAICQVERLSSRPTSEKDGNCCWGACCGETGNCSKPTFEWDAVLTESKLVP